MESDGDSPPFWSRPSSTLFHHHRRRSPPPIFTPVSLILIFPIIILFLIFFLILPFFSYVANFIRPTYSIKKSWDSFSFILVTFAILFGVFAKKNEDVSEDHNAGEKNGEDLGSSCTEKPSAEPVQTGSWYSDFSPVEPERGVNRLRRSSSSYPDLRRGPFWEKEETRIRFYDDLEVHVYRKPGIKPPASEDVNGGVERSVAEREFPDIKVIPVDTFEVSPSRTSAPPPPPLPPTRSAADLKERREFHTVPPGKIEENRSDEPQLDENLSPPILPSPPRPPPPSVAEVQEYVEHSPQKLQRRKSGKTKEIATAIASVYKQRKQKKKSKNSKTEDISIESSPDSAHSTVPSSTPPPPPPPPPPKVFQKLFEKNSKTKRVYSVSSPATPPSPPPPPPPNSIFSNLLKTGSISKRFSKASIPSSHPYPPPPPPPPPAPSNSILNNLFNPGKRSKRFSSISSSSSDSPPRSSIFNTLFKEGSMSSRFKSKSSTPPPPPPELKPKYTKSHSQILPSERVFRRPTTTYRKPSLFYEEIINSGSQSPLISVPPPPPLPPFRIPEFKFVARGDFVRIRSPHSSCCSSPGLEDVDEVPLKSSDGFGGSGLIGPSVVCASPDVNAKADNFIARLKDEWRLEKLKSGPNPRLKLD